MKCLFALILVVFLATQAAGQDELVNGRPWRTHGIINVEEAVGLGVKHHGTVSGTQVCSFSAGMIHTMTVAGDVTLDVAGWPSANREWVMRIYVTNGGAATVTYADTIKWPGGEAPDLQADGEDILIFISHDGGATLYGIVAADMATP